MSFRIYWIPQAPWTWYRDDGVSLLKHCRKNGNTDCYHSLNVYPDFEKKECYYDFGFDFDSPDIRNSAVDAKKLIDHLISLKIPYVLHFSGSKGIHVVVPHKVGGVPLREDGGHVCRLLQAQWKKDLDLPTLDVEIHGARRMWRVENSINSKKGLYKVPITRQELDEIADKGLEAAIGLASAPRPSYYVNAVLNQDFNDLLQPFIETANKENVKRETQATERRAIVLKGVPVCIQGVLNDPQRVVRQAKTWAKREPSRNKLTYLAACFFKDHAGASEDDCLKILGKEWQEKVAKISSSSPHTIQRSTETCIRAVYESSYQFSCGAAIANGCDCHPRCALYVPYDANKQKPA